MSINSFENACPVNPTRIQRVLLANNGIYYIRGRICEGIFNFGCEIIGACDSAVGVNIEFLVACEISLLEILSYYRNVKQLSRLCI